MTQKIADDFADISARLRELERRQKVLDDPEHIHTIQPKNGPFENYAVCTLCNGMGGFTNPHPANAQLPVFVACTRCNGSGSVPCTASSPMQGGLGRKP